MQTGNNIWFTGKLFKILLILIFCIGLHSQALSATRPSCGRIGLPACIAPAKACSEGYQSTLNNFCLKVVQGKQRTVAYAMSPMQGFLDEKANGGSNAVQYLLANQLPPKQIVAYNGSIYLRNNINQEFKDTVNQAVNANEILYVMDGNGNIYVHTALTTDGPPKIKHSSFFRGNDLASAGTLKWQVSGGGQWCVSKDSGHYRQGPQEITNRVIAQLHAMGVKTSQQARCPF